MAYYPGNGYTGITFGTYYGTVPVSFHPGIGTCVGESLHNLVADAATLAAAVQNAYSTWKNNNGAAQMESLLGSYAAGEIGALAFIAGTIDILGVAAVGLVIAGTGLTLYSLVAIAECAYTGNAIGYVTRGRKMMA
ncbi:MAG TPA: hypothetical protein VKT72_09935 [Candidatus Baltobacteraceae bacterium]|nr:hypothetical protein [Candidatus Baltobacteraceae bacterium]